jgi:hypothetical protein
MTRPDSHRIDLRFREALDHWIAEACPPGGFLNAVLCNDLSDAIGRGDEFAIDNLPHIVSYLYNDCPASCWGSPAKVKAWRGLTRLMGERHD